MQLWSRRTTSISRRTIPKAKRALGALERSFFGNVARQENPAGVLAHGECLDAIVVIDAASAAQIELASVQRADHASIANHAVGQRPLPVRTGIERGKKPAVTLAKNRDLFAFDDETTALSWRNGIDRTDIHGGAQRCVSHCSQRPPKWRRVPVPQIAA